MTNIVEQVIQDAVQAAPDSLALQAASAAVSTVENPSPMNILADIELITKLAAELRAKLVGVHPSVVNILKALF